MTLLASMQTKHEPLVTIFNFVFDRVQQLFSRSRTIHAGTNHTPLRLLFVNGTIYNLRLFRSCYRSFFVRDRFSYLNTVISFYTLKFCLTQFSKFLSLFLTISLVEMC